MKNKKENKGFFKKLFNDYKVVVSSEDTFEEKFAFKASKINVFVLMLVYSVILISFTISVVFFTQLRELVPGYSSSDLLSRAIYLTQKTDSLERQIELNNKFYKSISMNPIMVKKELPGYLSDRLQEALWREALHIVNEGYATTKDLDRAIEDGPGLRWSLMGTFLTFHLAGGKAGMKHMLEQFGPALKLPWTKLKAPKLSKKLSSRVIIGTRNQAKGKSVEKLSKIRDEYLVKLQKLRKKYEDKIRK